MIGWQRAIVEVRWAKLATRRAVIEPGGALRVGRAERADLPIPGDRAMSALHCELRWDGESCRVADLASQQGTWLNGERLALESAEVRNGDWIRAGNTVLSVYLEGATPPRREGVAASRDDVLAALQAEPAPLFAVLDAARTPRVQEVLHESVEEYQSLFEGMKGEALALQAPYLVRVPRGSRLAEQLVQEGWGHAWGVYLTCQRPFDEVRRQLRRILVVANDRTGDRMFFRFHDPQMLRLFLPTCSLRQREQMFGEIDAFLVEDRDRELMRFGKGEAPAVLTSRAGVTGLELEP